MSPLSRRPASAEKRFFRALDLGIQFPCSLQLRTIVRLRAQEIPGIMSKKHVRIYPVTWFSCVHQLCS